MQGRKAAWWRLCAAVVAALAVQGTVAAQALAGNYVINDCASAQVGNTTVGPWSGAGQSGSWDQSCSGGVGDWFGSTATHENANGYVYEFVQGSGTVSIKHIKVWWYVPAPSGGQ